MPNQQRAHKLLRLYFAISKSLGKYGLERVGLDTAHRPASISVDLFLTHLMDTPMIDIELDGLVDANAVEERLCGGILGELDFIQQILQMRALWVGNICILHVSHTEISYSVRKAPRARNTSGSSASGMVSDT